MTAVLLAVHVLGSILLVGPIAVAASLFPRIAAERVGSPAAPADAPVAAPADAAPATPGGSTGAGAGPSDSARLLHRICRGYTVVAVVVPVFGIATGARLGVLGDAWLLVSLALTVVAAGVLALAILPGQRSMLDATERSDGAVLPATARRLAMLTGIFNLLWAVVVVLMIVRPGSTTGV